MQDFFRNVSRYPRYFITILLGVFWNFLEPLLPLLKRPTTAIALVGVFLGGLAFIAFTLQAMLGLQSLPVQ
jgi:membrane protein insertase Oxa1/YidC/SpoIIIJ